MKKIFPERTGILPTPRQNGVVGSKSHCGAGSRDLSWRRNFPGLVDARTAMLKELWDHMGSFSQGLHQAVWDVLQN